jgi:hypothetical protein
MPEGCRSGVWETTLFSLSSQIYGNLSFSFYLSCAPCFLYLNAANKSVLLLYAYAHKISLKYLFPENIAIEIYFVKNARRKTHFVWQTFFQWISRVCQIANIKYIHQNLRYYVTIVQLLYFSGNHLPLVMIYEYKMVTLKNLILKYIGMKNINILKRKWHVGINVVFSECDIETVWCMFHEKQFHCPMNMFAPFWPWHNY